VRIGNIHKPKGNQKSINIGTDNMTSTTSSEEVEMTVLSCMINSQDDLLVAIDAIDADDFADLRHVKIFKAIKEARDKKGVVDVIILAEILKGSGNLQESGGYAYLATLSQCSGPLTHIEAYCEDLRQLTVKRKLFEVQKNIIRDIESGIEPHKVLERVDQKVQDIKVGKPKANSLFRHLLDPTTENDIIQEIRNTSPGVDVGFKIGKVDLRLPGGAITIVAGPTGHGKTMVLINFILNYLECNPGKRAYFFSYEESKSSILSLFLNTYINKELSHNNRESIKSHFRDGDVQYISEKNRGIFLKEKQEFFADLIQSGRLNILYSDYSAEELVQAIRFLKENTDTGVVAIDYMQLLSLLNKKNTPRQEELKQICLMLKDCAVDTGLPILLAGQFNRTVASEADLSPTAIGEAGDIERAANIVIGLWNRNYEGFSRDGNRGKDKKSVPKESAMYMEIMKGRETGIGHSSVFDLNGNTGKLSARVPEKIYSQRQEIHVAEGVF